MALNGEALPADWHSVRGVQRGSNAERDLPSPILDFPELLRQDDILPTQKSTITQQNEDILMISPPSTPLPTDWQVVRRLRQPPQSDTLERHQRQDTTASLARISGLSCSNGLSRLQKWFVASLHRRVSCKLPRLRLPRLPQGLGRNVCRPSFMFTS
jgi:hypothetical protein